MVDKADDSLHLEVEGWNWGRGLCLVTESLEDGIALVPWHLGTKKEG